MKYKALILDLDGTVVANGTNNLPSARVTAAIAKAKERIHICIATGRPLFLAKPVLDHLELSGPCVLNNGTQIYDPVKKEVLREYPLDKESLSKILKVFAKFKKKLRIFDGIKDENLDTASYPETVFSVFLESIEPKETDNIIAQLSGISGIACHKMLSWKREDHHSLEITSDQATKLHGIVMVSKLLGVGKDEIIGVGDSYNDFSLLMASGLKFAMGNAVPELKAIADFIGPPVEQDGVAKIIDTFILGQ